jgi:hypothetical protein
MIAPPLPAWRAFNLIQDLNNRFRVPVIHRNCNIIAKAYQALMHRYCQQPDDPLWYPLSVTAFMAGMPMRRVHPRQPPLQPGELVALTFIGLRFFRQHPLPERLVDQPSGARIVS